MKTPEGDVTVTDDLASHMEFYLIRNGYVDVDRRITDKYHDAKREETLAALPSVLTAHSEQVFSLIDSVFSDAQLPEMVDDAKTKVNPLNSNFNKKEFKELWNRINQKAVYTVHFDSPELIKKCVAELNSELRVSELQYTIQLGNQTDTTTVDELERGESFKLAESATENVGSTIHSGVKYDIIGKIAVPTKLTRRTVAEILSQIEPSVFDQFKKNPEDFLSKMLLFINEQKATMIVEHLQYNPIDDRYATNIFTQDKTKRILSGDILKRHIYDYVVTDSQVERKFVTNLDTSEEVVVYAKLPKGFAIPTPVGDYNPDWAISFKEGAVKHVYFIAETKGSMSSMELRKIEQSKIECARKFFTKITSNLVSYDVIDSYEKLMEIVK